MSVEVNYLAVFLAVVSSLVVGSVWYMKGVFGTQWMKLTGRKEADVKNGSMMPIVVTMLVTVVTAYVLAHVAFLSNAYFQNSFFQDAVTTAFWLWAGLTAARLVTHDVFEGRPWKLTAINAAHEFVTLMVMGGVIGLLKP